MLQNHYNWLRWEQDGIRYIVDMDGIKGVWFRPANDAFSADTLIYMGEGVTYSMKGEYAEAFADWYWRTKTADGFKVPDLDVP